MKVIVDLNKKTLKMLENDRSIFRGEYGADKLELLINKQLIDEYPSITGLLSNGRKIGAFTTDEVYGTETIDGVTYTTAIFTLSKQNGFTLSEGKTQITIWLNKTNSSGEVISKEALGNVTLNVINTTAFDDGDIIISGDVEGTLVNYKIELENLSSQINNWSVNIANLTTQLGNIRNIGTITTLDDLNTYTTNGTYTFTYVGKECLMLVNNTMNYPVQMIIVSSAREERIIREYYNNNWTITLNDFAVYESDLDEVYDRTLDLEESKASIEYVDNKFNQLFGEGQVSKTLDTIAEISRALEENVDVVEKLDESITNKADKSYVDDLLYGLNIYDYIVTNNPYVEDDTLYLENGYVRDGTLYLKNAKVENGVLYIDYIE